MCLGRKGKCFLRYDKKKELINNIFIVFSQKNITQKVFPTILQTPFTDSSIPKGYKERR